MASVYYLYDDAVHTEEDIVMKYTDHEKEAKITYFAAVKIQSAYRGYMVRMWVKMINAAATKIQKTTRGWLLRYHLPDIMHEYLDRMRVNYYYRMATRIQALWRGYTVRKVICIKDMREQRNKTLAANEKMINALKEQQEMNNRLQPATVQEVLEALLDRHHLLRTQQCEGIFSIHNSKELSELEKILSSVRWSAYMKKVRKMYNVYSKNNDIEYMFTDKSLRKQEDMARLRDQTNEPKEAREIFQLDIHDKPLNASLEEKKYDRMIMTTGQYAVAQTEIVRTEDRSKQISKKDFDLHVLKQIATESDVPTYYIDFWFEKCSLHNLR